MIDDVIEGTRCILDASDYSAVWRCLVCDHISIDLSADDAEAAARKHHARNHPSVCTKPMCDRPVRRNGMCNTHSIAAHRAARKEPA